MQKHSVRRERREQRSDTVWYDLLRTEVTDCRLLTLKRFKLKS